MAASKIQSIKQAGQMSREAELEEGSKMFIKYFENNFDLHKLALSMKRNIRQVEAKLREEVKNLLIELEGTLFRAKRISNMIFISMTNPEIEKKMINFDRILDKKQSFDFLCYYRSRMVEFSVSNPHHFETVYPISIDSRLRIYQRFVEFARNESISNQKRPAETGLDIIRKGFTYDKLQIFDQRDLELVYTIYEKNDGDIEAMCEQFGNRGFKDVKFEKNVLSFKIANLKLLGLYTVYKKTAQWMDDHLLRWNKFIKCYANIYETWSLDENKKLIKIAISEQPALPEVKQITLKMGRQSAACFLEMLEQTRYEEVPQDKVVYEEVTEQISKFEEIPKFEQIKQRIQDKEKDHLADSIRDEIRKKLMKIKRDV